MNDYKVIIKVSIPDCNDEQEAINFVADNVGLSEFNLELNGEREVPPSQPAILLRAVDDILEYLKESESVGGEIDGWENLQLDLVDLRHKALEEGS